MLKKLMTIGVLILISACGKAEQKKVEQKKEIVKVVKSEELNTKTFENIKTYNGELEPKEEVSIVTSSGGDVQNIHFKNGDKVKKGDVILELSNKDVEASYFEAQGKLLKAKSTLATEKISFDKYKKLYAKKIISENDYLAMENKYNLAQGEEKIAQGSLIRAKDSYDKLKVVSLIDGVVTDLKIKKYEKVEGKTKILTVVDDKKMEVTIAVSGMDIKNLKVGDRAEVEVEEVNEKKTGVVSEINLSSDTNSKKYSLKIEIDNSDGKILKGMYAKVKLSHGNIEGLFIPTKAIMIKELYSYIAVIREGKAVIYRVEPKMTIGDYQLVDFPEYEAGDRVVVEGQYLLNNNDMVREN